MTSRTRGSSWASRILPNHKDHPEKRSVKLIVLMITGMILLMVLISLVTFWLSVRGDEEVLLPSVERKQLIDALLELQKKELYARVQVRYSSEYERGLIMEQSPAAGSLVKTRRQVILIVRKGPVIDRVENYVGRKVDEVRIHLQTIFASYRALVKIKEPVMGVFSEEPAGTILAQKPAPDTIIDGEILMELVVSRGPKGELIEVGDFTKMHFQDAVAELAALNVPFVFTLKREQGSGEPGFVVSQSPAPESEIPYGTVIQLVMNHPGRLEPGQVFGIFEYVLPEYPIMVDVSLDAITPDESTTLLSMKHPGGPIAIPYVVTEKSELVLNIFGKEEIRLQAGLSVP